MNIEPLIVFDIVLIVLILGAFVVSLIGLGRVIQEGFLKKWNMVAGTIFGLLFVSYLIYNVILHKIEPTGWAQIFLTLGLIMATGLYALVAFRQARASVKMAEETRQQRVMASRPVIIQKAVVETETELATFGSKDWFSYFEVYNAGNGPAIEVEISLLNKEKTPIHSQRKTFLRAGEPPIQFSSHPIYPEKPTFYLVCEYQSIFSRETWYQTWLPFEAVEASEDGKIYVKPGELEFKEVSERERIDAFGSGRKPK